MHAPPRRRPKPDAPVRRYRAVVSYDGTAYAGWQVQPRQRTVQGEIEKALAALTGQDVRVNCSGRTDTGVHARGQVIHFDLATGMTLAKLHLGLNAKLPDDIRVARVRRAAPDFDARFSATGKEYRYFIWNAPTMAPDLRHTRTHVRARLDVNAMQLAARQLVGRHDFAAFCANPGYERDGTVRRLFDLRVTRKGAEVLVIARGEGFLYRMVRSLAGFLIRVGLGEVPPEDASSIMASKVRTARVPTAPARGLFLWRVW
jgi:tRNA pseudouridine38-40 synthase